MLETIAQGVARVTFMPTLAYNLLMERLSSRRWWDRVDDRIILGDLKPIHRLSFNSGAMEGAIPFRSTYTASLVASEGISGVVALNEPYELSLCSYQTAGWNKLGVKYFNLHLISVTSKLILPPLQS